MLEQRLPLFPQSTQLLTNGNRPRLAIGGCDVQALAEQYGTPLYLYDRETLDGAVAAYRAALAEHYPGESGLTYAGKAYLCLAMAQWVGQSDLWLDCTGAGELHIAAAAKLPQSAILVHGVNKSPADLTAAAQAGTLVVDNLTELKRIASRLRRPIPNLWLRLRPGMAVETHAYTQTGQDDSKFGMSPAEIETAVQFCLERGEPLTGLHFHQGSHFHDPAPVAPALEVALDLLVKLRERFGWLPEVISPGGGWGVPYHEDDLPHPEPAEYVGFIAGQLIAGCQQRGLPLPRLQLEPGRSLVAQAGVAVYRVGAVKHTAHRRWLLLDGGLADNPRPALYGARYTALPVERPERPQVGPAWLAGPYCESGDILIEDLPLPEIEPGELIAVPVSGAYQLSMSSNYNGARRPAVVWVDHGAHHLIQRRESLEDLLRRDCPLQETDSTP